MSKRQDIVDRVKAVFEGITVAGGYQTDIGRNVEVWRLSPVDTDELPILVITDTVNRRNDDEYGTPIGQMGWRLTVEATCLVSDGTDTVETLRKAAADMLKAVGVLYADSTIIASNAVVGQPELSEYTAEHKDAVVGSCKIAFTIAYFSSLWTE